MIESLFALSIGFLGYVVYALVGEQVAGNAGTTAKRTTQSAKPLTAGAKTETATASKAKPKAAAKKKAPAKATATAKSTATKATAAKKKPTAKPVSPPVNPVIAYLEKNGQTSIAKLTRELPDDKQAIQDNIDRLLQDGKITQKTVGRAKTIALS